MRKVIAMANQKGGVGKTTTAMNLGTALSLKGMRVLIIDADPQGNLSSYLGFERKKESITFTDVVDESVGRNKDKEGNKKKVFAVSDCIHNSEINKVDYVPADMRLGHSEGAFSKVSEPLNVIKNILADECFKDYDYIIIDCKPSFGSLLLSIFNAVDGIIIPVQSQKFACDGVKSLRSIYEQMKKANSKLELIGVVATFVENTTISRNVQQQLADVYGEKMFSTFIHRSVDAQLSSSNGKSLCLPNFPNKKNKKINLGEEYMALASEVMQRCSA